MVTAAMAAVDSNPEETPKIPDIAAYLMAGLITAVLAMLCPLDSHSSHHCQPQTRTDKIIIGMPLLLFLSRETWLNYIPFFLFQIC